MARGETFVRNIKNQKNKAKTAPRFRRKTPRHTFTTKLEKIPNTKRPRSDKRRLRHGLINNASEINSKEVDKGVRSEPADKELNSSITGEPRPDDSKATNTNETKWKRSWVQDYLYFLHKHEYLSKVRPKWYIPTMSVREKEPEVPSVRKTPPHLMWNDGKLRHSDKHWQVLADTLEFRCLLDILAYIAPSVPIKTYNNNEKYIAVERWYEGKFQNTGDKLTSRFPKLVKFRSRFIDGRYTKVVSQDPSQECSHDSRLLGPASELNHENGFTRQKKKHVMYREEGQELSKVNSLDIRQHTWFGTWTRLFHLLVRWTAGFRTKQTTPEPITSSSERSLPPDRFALPERPSAQVEAHGLQRFNRSLTSPLLVRQLFEVTQTPSQSTRSSHWRTAVVLDIELGAALDMKFNAVNASRRGCREVSMLDLFSGKTLIHERYWTENGDYVSLQGVEELIRKELEMLRLERSPENIKFYSECYLRNKVLRDIFKFVGPETYVITYAGRNDMSFLGWMHDKTIDIHELQKISGGKTQGGLQRLLSRTVGFNYLGSKHDALVDCLGTRELVGIYSAEILRGLVKEGVGNKTVQRDLESLSESRLYDPPIKSHYSNFIQGGTLCLRRRITSTHLDKTVGTKRKVKTDKLVRTKRGVQARLDMEDLQHNKSSELSSDTYLYGNHPDVVKIKRKIESLSTSKKIGPSAKQILLEEYVSALKVIKNQFYDVQNAMDTGTPLSLEQTIFLQRAKHQEKAQARKGADSVKSEIFKQPSQIIIPSLHSEERSTIIKYLQEVLNLEVTTFSLRQFDTSARRVQVLQDNSDASIVISPIVRFYLEQNRLPLNCRFTELSSKYAYIARLGRWKLATSKHDFNMIYVNSLRNNLLWVWHLQGYNYHMDKASPHRLIYQDDAGTQEFVVDDIDFLNGIPPHLSDRNQKTGFSDLDFVPDKDSQDIHIDRFWDSKVAKLARGAIVLPSICSEHRRSSISARSLSILPWTDLIIERAKAVAPLHYGKYETRFQILPLNNVASYDEIFKSMEPDSTDKKSVMSKNGTTISNEEMDVLKKPSLTTTRSKHAEMVDLEQEFKQVFLDVSSSERDFPLVPDPEEVEKPMESNATERTSKEVNSQTDPDVQVFNVKDVKFISGIPPHLKDKGQNTPPSETGEQGDAAEIMRYSRVKDDPHDNDQITWFAKQNDDPDFQHGFAANDDLANHKELDELDAPFDDNIQPSIPHIRLSNPFPQSTFEGKAADIISSHNLKTSEHVNAFLLRKTITSGRIDLRLKCNHSDVLTTRLSKYLKPKIPIIQNEIVEEVKIGSQPEGTSMRAIRRNREQKKIQDLSSSNVVPVLNTIPKERFSLLGTLGRYSNSKAEDEKKEKEKAEGKER